MLEKYSISVGVSLQKFSKKAQKYYLTPALPSIGTLPKMFHLVWGIRVGVQTIFKQSFSANFVNKVVLPWKFLFQLYFF